MIANEGRQKLQSETWNRLLRERVGEPLRPDRLRSLLMIVPAASGDVALNTTVVRHVKRHNPECRISFATRRVNAPLVRMCPGVDDVIEMPRESGGAGRHGWETLSRRKYLEDYAGRADAVLCTCFFPEDADLLTEHRLNALEAIRLLAGLPEGAPPEPPRVWIESPLAPAAAAAVIRRSLGGPARSALFKRAVRRLPESIARIARTHSVQGSGIKVVGKDIRGLRNVRAVSDPVHTERLGSAALDRDFVLLGTQATSLSPPPPGVVSALVAVLSGAGRTVLHNVRDPLHAAPGTIPLVCSYEEFVCLRGAGIPFVGWRDGLCDAAAASRAPMCVFSPPTHDLYNDIPGMFGLRSMGLDANCLEVVCRGVDDVERSGLLDHLDKGPHS